MDTKTTSLKLHWETIAILQRLSLYRHNGNTLGLA